MTELYGTTRAGARVTRHVLARDGMRAEVITYGATLVALDVPGRDGRPGDVVLGLASLPAYEASTSRCGAIVGRYANRIAGGRFTLDGVVHELARNDGPNTLHGGPNGLDGKVWTVEDEGEARLRLSVVSPDGEDGFPGRLRVEVAYALEPGALRIEARATTDRPTVINLTNHTYFNLEGEGASDALGHRVAIPADAYLPTDAAQLPTGEVRPVADTPFDLRGGAVVIERVRRPDPQLLLAHGFDHTFVLGPLDPASGLRPAGTVEAPASGRRLEVLTTAPGVQFYTGNNLDGSLVGRGGLVYRQSAGLCLETQAFPDAPNHPGFPSTVLRPGETWRATTLWRFGAA